jgi:hypothetical protein
MLPGPFDALLFPREPRPLAARNLPRACALADALLLNALAVANGIKSP